MQPPAGGCDLDPFFSGESSKTARTPVTYSHTAQDPRGQKSLELNPQLLTCIPNFLNPKLSILKAQLLQPYSHTWGPSAPHGEASHPLERGNGLAATGAWLFGVLGVLWHFFC